jgi:hypothetical protein
VRPYDGEEGVAICWNIATTTSPSSIGRRRSEDLPRIEPVPVGITSGKDAPSSTIYQVQFYFLFTEFYFNDLEESELF